jgi:hypothetical protein
LKTKLFTAEDWHRIGTAILYKLAQTAPSVDIVAATPQQAETFLDRQETESVIKASKVAELADLANCAMMLTAVQIQAAKTMLATWSGYRKASDHITAAPALKICRGVIAELLRIVEPAIEAFIPWQDECRAHGYDVSQWHAMERDAKELKTAVIRGEPWLAGLARKLNEAGQAKESAAGSRRIEPVNFDPGDM